MKTTSGYTDCCCRDCFEIAISNNWLCPAFCLECQEAGCGHDEECKRSDAYGMGEEAQNNDE
jgi:hypothetical protein